MLGAGKLEIFAQNFQQSLVYRDQDRDYFTVDAQVENVLHATIPHAPEQV
jgi:hypothetical protein